MPRPFPIGMDPFLASNGPIAQSPRGIEEIRGSVSSQLRVLLWGHARCPSLLGR